MLLGLDIGEWAILGWLTICTAFILRKMQTYRNEWAKQRVDENDYFIRAHEKLTDTNEKMLERVQIIVDDILVRESLGEIRGRELRGDDWSKLVEERKNADDE